MTSETICKRCAKCDEDKPLTMFSRDKQKKDGRYSKCKNCVAQYNHDNALIIREQRRIRRAANTEMIRAYNRAYRKANAEAIRVHKIGYYAAHIDTKREYDRAYRAANREAIREYQRSYRQTNAEAILSYRQANPEAMRAYKRAYHLAHPDVRRAAGERRRARQRGNGGTFTSQELFAMRVAQAGICAYCQRQHDPDTLTIDHIIPLTQGGRHEAANICLACLRCNLNKSNRTPEQWVNRWYLRE